MPDEEVVDLAKAGQSAATEFLITRYRPLVETKAKAYFVIGADREDVIQEGMIGLYKAIRDFRNERPHKFRPFAELCVTRQIITAIKTATRQKHVPLNACVSLDREEGEPTQRKPEPRDMVDFGLGPVEELPAEVCEGLSEFEREVLRAHLSGHSYREMSLCFGCGTKSIDNALQRVKRKVSVILRK